MLHTQDDVEGIVVCDRPPCPGRRRVKPSHRVLVRTKEARYRIVGRVNEPSQGHHVLNQRPPQRSGLELETTVDQMNNRQAKSSNGHVPAMCERGNTRIIREHRQLVTRPVQVKELTDDRSRL